MKIRNEAQRSSMEAPDNSVTMETSNPSNTSDGFPSD